MVERMGICEKHQLPLDRNGECELCRLSDMPSKVPPARSAWWALIVPLVLVAGGTAWALVSFESEPGDVPQRGVRVAVPRPVSSPPPREEPRVPGPETVPEPPPVPGDDVPIPGPSPTSTRLDEGAPRGTPPTTANIPEWKWNIARRRVMITMYATQWCGVCRKAREYMQTNRIDFIELDTDESSVAGERLGELNPGRTIPTFQIDDQVYIGFQEDLFEARINQAAQKHL